MVCELPSGTHCNNPQLVLTDQFLFLRLQEERDLAEKEARDKETKILSLTRELEEMEDQMADFQRKYMSQKREYDEIVSSKDDVGKSVHDLEKVSINIFLQ